MTQPPLRATIIPVTPIEQNCTLIWCTATMKAAVIDPGGDLPKIEGVSYMEDPEYTVVSITVPAALEAEEPEEGEEVEGEEGEEAAEGEGEGDDAGVDDAGE